jgi:amidohydrolase
MVNGLDDGFRADLRDLRRQLHAEPETGLQLPRTQERVIAALEHDVSGPLTIVPGRSCSSVTAVLEGALPGPSVLLRADMDALPVSEQVDVPYRSRNLESMHACGHDLHTAMLVGAARLLSAERSRLAGSVVFMFQPGEEGFDGAGRMIDDGILNVTGELPVAAYALHVMSAMWPRGVFATKPGPLLAAADGIYVTVRGAGGHGSAPQLARDPIPAACEMVTALQTVVSRRIDPFSPAVVTVGQFHAGTKRTIIPETAEFEITVRVVDEGVRSQISSAVAEICEHVARAHRLEATVVCRQEFDLTVNDGMQAEQAAAAVGELFGDHRIIELAQPIMGSEDFSRILAGVPGAMVFLGACPPAIDYRTAAYNHSPAAQFDDEVLGDGAALYAELALRATATGHSAARVAELSNLGSSWSLDSSRATAATSSASL